MGFNYLQTDDRDDYFASLGSNKPHKPHAKLRLISPSGEIVLDNKESGQVRAYCKKTYLPFGVSGRKIWRKLLEDKGYKIIKIN